MQGPFFVGVLPPYYVEISGWVCPSLLLYPIPDQLQHLPAIADALDHQPGIRAIRANNQDIAESEYPQVKRLQERIVPNPVKLQLIGYP